MNKAQLAQAKEDVAQKKTYSQSAIDALTMHNVNTIIAPLMKSLGKGFAHKVGSKPELDKPKVTTEHKGMPNSGPLYRSFNAMSLGKGKYGKDRT